MFMPTPRPKPQPTPIDPTAQRYYVMGTSSLPVGAAFTVKASHWYLLTEFTLGFLSVQEVVAALTADVPVGPAR